MVTFGASRFGQDLGSGVEEALFLKVFGGEVLLAFERFAVTNGRVRTRSIKSGKSAQFPLMGAMSATYHVPGQNIIEEGGATPTYLSQPKHGEKVISIDGILQASTLIATIDEAMTHYDVRAPYAREMGWALAKQFDVNTMWTIFSGANKSAHISGDASDWGKGGYLKVAAAFDTTLATTKSELKLMAQNWDENDVAETGRHVAMDPKTYYLLADDNDVVSADFNRNTGGDRGRGAQAQLMLYGVNLHKTNRLVDLRAQGAKHAEQLGTDYTNQADLSKVTGLGWQQDHSVGVVKLKELGIATQWMLQYLATLMVGGFSTGHGVLHESACAAIKNA